MLDARGLFAMVRGRRDGLPVIRFAEAHAAAGRAQHQREIFGWLPSGLLPRFVSG